MEEPPPACMTALDFSPLVALGSTEAAGGQLNTRSTRG
jgi:hypothetical protein